MTTVNVEMYFAPTAEQPSCTVNPKKFRLHTGDPKLDNCGIYLPETYDGKVKFKIKKDDNDTRNITFDGSTDSIKYVVLSDPDHSTNDPQQPGYIFAYADKISNYEISAHYVPFGDNIQYSVKYFIGTTEKWIDPGVRYPGFLAAHLLILASLFGAIATAVLTHFAALALLRRRA